MLTTQRTSAIQSSVTTPTERATAAHHSETCTLRTCLLLNVVATGFTVVVGLWTTVLVRTRAVRQ